METMGLERIWVSGTGAAELAAQGRGFSKPSLMRALKGSGHLTLKDGSPAVKVALTQGRMKMPLVITGTTQAPSFGLDTEAVKAQVEAQAKAKAAEATGNLLSNVLQKSQNALMKPFGQ